jgi:hypothetical protein
MEKLIKDLETIYFNFLTDALSNDAIYFVELKNIDLLAEKLGERIGIEPDFEESWKRATKKRSSLKISVCKEADERYHHLLEGPLKERMYPLYESQMLGASG